ncbi:hypothetical protein L7F22_015809 [Adiantum nelumboides]|nr:hypothetical protein [Adiantum nelumboides]
MADTNTDVFKMFAAEDRLDGDNYPMWAYMMQHVLVSKGVWNIVQGIDVRLGSEDVGEIEDVAGLAAVRFALPTAEQARCAGSCIDCAVSKLKYGTSLANVDWLHGGAESLLTLTNLFIVLGLRQAVRENDEDTSVTENEENTQ